MPIINYYPYEIPFPVVVYRTADRLLAVRRLVTALRSARPKRISRRPTFPTNRTYTQKTSDVTGRYVHMNWGWETYKKAWYATDESWEEKKCNFKWKRHMLVITGHN